MAVFGGVTLYRTRLRPWMYTWGASDDEIQAVLPGDELVSARTPRTTRAMTVDATHHRGMAMAGAKMSASVTRSGSPAATAMLHGWWWLRWRQDRTWC
jgi:hypothetical protein